MTGSITVTREELEREVGTILQIIRPEASLQEIAELAVSATDTLFTNAKAREETRADKAEARVAELEEQIEHGYVRRRCANLKCPDESFMPSRIDQQYCGKRCRDAHGQRVANQRKRLRHANTHRGELGT